MAVLQSTNSQIGEELHIDLHARRIGAQQALYSYQNQFSSERHDKLLTDSADY
jgi:hypothetical protein